MLRFFAFRKMKIIDYIIVGDGFAAYFLAHRLIREGKSFMLFSDGITGASGVSAGVVNPVVLKKFTTFWLAQEQIDALHKTLEEMSAYTGRNYWIYEPVFRVFHDEAERDLWLKKSGTDELRPFLSTDFTFFDEIHNPFGCGEVLQSGRVDVPAFFSDFSSYLHTNGHDAGAAFDYNLLEPENNIYLDFKYRHVVFCEGMGVVQNPWFHDLAVSPNKGHHLLVKLPAGSTKSTVKKKHFLFPLNEGHWYYGGTYDRNGVGAAVDEKAVAELESGLSQLASDYTVEEVRNGFRPTVRDRRPILGAHFRFGNLFVMNGLGGRGLLNGNYFAEELFRHIEYGESLRSETDIARFGSE